MLETYLRPALQQYCLNPSAKWLTTKWQLKANSVTLIALLTGLCAALGIALNWPVLFILLLLLLSGFADMLDGSIARLTNTSSDIGTVFDIMSDRVVEAAIILAFYLQMPEQRALVCLLLLASILCCVSSFLLVGLFSSQVTDKSFYYSPGLIERAEAFVFFASMLIWPKAFLGLSYILIALIILTTCIRLFEFIRNSHAHQRNYCHKTKSQLSTATNRKTS